ncbi:UvrD-helicase domain-containing protein [Flavobacterium sp. WW92]|uniref:UvrD-helicase domain-containing protein n=1 Tax=unclassified Flavobacterium TaxID=196869 RepID=UPI002224AEAC|nr:MULTISPECIES: UvrD-helicase domain-containing protein [unclassified Flavobacterium]WDO12344.1 UvrD-helicase domain-containing protein [Flavobacterium sp. WW92]
MTQKQQQNKATLVIAGPGAGKTHNMVEQIISELPKLSASRYMAVITYTNAARQNIYRRLSERIAIPENLFIGTMHAFLNRFLVIPFSNFGIANMGEEKLFMQCDLDEVVKKMLEVKNDTKRKSPKELAVLKSIANKWLNEKGYITYDQTISIAKVCIGNTTIRDIVGNRLQFLFVDEFQDSGNSIYNIIEAIRKAGLTKLYCVGDPEQYIMSYDSSIKFFSNIPILKAASSTGYDVSVNTSNHRCAENIVTFLNKFNARTYGKGRAEFVFEQVRIKKEDTELKGSISYIQGKGVVKEIIDKFYERCEALDVPFSQRCIIAKKSEVIKRITAAINDKFMGPVKGSESNPLKMIQDTLLSVIRMSSKQYFEVYNTDIYGLRKDALRILWAIEDGTITNENTFVVFLQDELKRSPKQGLPVKIESLRFSINRNTSPGIPVVSTIHSIKGLEYDSVLVIAKGEDELKLWLETRMAERDKVRTRETTDYPRLGYVAFSRAKKFLCIGCLTEVSRNTLDKLENLGVDILN